MLPSEFYEGDLFKFVLMVKPESSAESPVLWRRANDIAQVVWSTAGDMEYRCLQRDGMR